MQMKFLLLTILILNLFNSWAYSSENKAILFGGNCDPSLPVAGSFFDPGPKQSSNTFRLHFINATDGLVRQGWDVDVLFGNERSRCTLLSTDVKCKPTPLSSECCANGIDPSRWTAQPIADVAKIPLSKLKKGSKEELWNSLDSIIKSESPPKQLLLALLSHGSPEQDGKKHGVCLDDGSYLALDDPEFISRLRKIKDKGVRLGFMDGSCYSGATVNYLSPLGCVLSSQDKDDSTLAQGGVFMGLADIMRMDKNETKRLTSLSSDFGRDKSMSLDDVFVKTIVSHPDMDVLGGFANRPQISDFPAIYDICRKSEIGVFVDGSPEEKEYQCQEKERETFLKELGNIVDAVDRLRQCQLYKAMAPQWNLEDMCLSDIITEHKNLKKKVGKATAKESALLNRLDVITAKLRSIKYKVTYKLTGPLKGNTEKFIAAHCRYYHCQDVPKIDGDEVSIEHDAANWKLAAGDGLDDSSQSSFRSLAKYILEALKADGVKVSPDDQNSVESFGDFMRRMEAEGLETLGSEKQRYALGLQMEWQTVLKQDSEVLTTRTVKDLPRSESITQACRYYSFLAARAYAKKKQKPSSCSEFKLLKYN